MVLCGPSRSPGGCSNPWTTPNPPLPPRNSMEDCFQDEELSISQSHLSSPDCTTLIIKTKQKTLVTCPCILALVASGPPCDGALLVQVMACTVARSAAHHGEYLLPNFAGVWVSSPHPPVRHTVSCLLKFLTTQPSSMVARTP